ncbi:hypothetical protein EON65_48585, partial [archaeon]
MMQLLVYFLSLCICSTIYGSFVHRHECVEKFIFEGVWGDDRNLTKDEHIGLRYHSLMQEPCQLSDFLKASSANEVVRGHLNEAIENEMLFRLKALRGKTWLTIGTSIDHRNLRIACPLFRAEEFPELIEHGDLRMTVLHCRLPKLDFTIAYAFAGAIVFNYTESDTRAKYNAVYEIFNTTASLPHPDFLTLSGIEWDIKENINVSKTELYTTTLPHRWSVSAVTPR